MNISSAFNKTGSLGAIVAALGCASCFPPLAALGATLGLGFLSRFEGLFINTLLPAFAVLALCTNIIIAYKRRSILYSFFGISGPLMVLATLYLFWFDNWSTYLFYAGLVLMLVVSVVDMFIPVNRVCKTASTPPAAR